MTRSDPDFYVRQLLADLGPTFTDLGFHPNPGGVDAAMDWLRRVQDER